MRILDIAELLLLAALWGGSFLFRNGRLSYPPIRHALGCARAARSRNGINDIRLWFGIVGNCDRK